VIELAPSEIWFVCGSQHLYGPGPLETVRTNAETVARGLDASASLPVPVVFKGVLTTPEEIYTLCLEANSSPTCAGLVIWMHTFSPAKMWIRGLNILSKPLCHLHTQFNRDLPWDTIDMDFMNLNQAAHGDREAAHLHTRLGLRRKVVVGHWSDPRVHEDLGVWVRSARAWLDWQGARFARIGDNMRFVAVTEGDKVAAETQFGFSVNTYGVGDLVEHVRAAENSAVTALLKTYETEYDLAPELRAGGARRASLEYAARLEAGMRSFLATGGFKGFTDTFEDLHGLEQLPGLATQRLMMDGYGFGGEGDWKTAALVRATKVMAHGLPGGASFMEDYTYHLKPEHELVLGAHMLEVCPSIADAKPRVEVQPLGIGGKADPVRLVFNASAGQAVNASLVDLGARFRLIVAQVQALTPPALPHLPVARAVWRCLPDFRTATHAWLLAGGAHHTAYSPALGVAHLEDFARIAGVECAVIDEDTRLREFERGLRPAT
jgi:L-arabinose isomerase